MADPRGPLGGVKVLDYGTMGPGGRACRILADYGAAVIRVVPPAAAGRHELPFYAYGGMRGFRRIEVDLKPPGGREVVLDLAGSSDVVVEGFRPGVADRLGIGYAAVRVRNPAVVYCAASGYGQSGPAALTAGHDLNYLAATGYLSTGEPGAGGGPALPGATVADAAGGGMHAALAVVASLLEARSSGEGAYLDVAASDGMLSIMAVNIEQYLATGREPEPGGDLLTGRYACYRVYRCGDDRWLSVAAVEPAFFANLCRELGEPELAARQYDDVGQDEVVAALAAMFATRDRDEWVADLAGRDTCVAAVMTVAEVVAHPHHRGRGAFVVARHPEHGTFDQLGPVLAGCPKVAQPVDLPVGTEGPQILRDIGYTDLRITELVAAGVVS